MAKKKREHDEEPSNEDFQEATNLTISDGAKAVDVYNAAMAVYYDAENVADGENGFERQIESDGQEPVTVCVPNETT